MGPNQDREDTSPGKGALLSSCHAGDGGKERALPGPDFWSPEACRREDGGGGGRVVRADFPLRAEQTAVNYWKAEPPLIHLSGGPPSRDRAAWGRAQCAVRRTVRRTGLLPNPQRGCGRNSLRPPPEWPGLQAGGSAFLWTLTSHGPRPGAPGSVSPRFTHGAWGERSPICGQPEEPRGGSIPAHPNFRLEGPGDHFASSQDQRELQVQNRAQVP